MNGNIIHNVIKFFILRILKETKKQTCPNQHKFDSRALFVTKLICVTLIIVQYVATSLNHHLLTLDVCTSIHARDIMSFEIRFDIVVS